MSEQTEHNKELFLQAFRNIGTIYSAAKACKIGRTQVYEWLHTDPQFKADFEVAKQDAIEEVEAALICAAKGKSDLARIFYLKHNRPDVYGDQVKVSGQIDHRVILKFVPVPSLANPSATQGIGEITEGELVGGDETGNVSPALSEAS